MFFGTRKHSGLADLHLENGQVLIRINDEAED